MTKSRSSAAFFRRARASTIPLSTRASESRLAATRTGGGRSAAYRLDTRKAWFHAVAAQETAKYSAQVREAAETSAELARRMAEVGNFPKLTYARAGLPCRCHRPARARAHNATATRERLARLMGLWGEDLAFQLPDRLPDLPKAPREGGDLEAQAMAQRLDVQGRAVKPNLSPARSG